MKTTSASPTTPLDWPAYPPRWDGNELKYLEEALRQPSLFYWKGAQTRRLTELFQQQYPLRHVMPVSSGSAAIHAAVASIGVSPGDEVITTPITDMGSLIGILYQQAVPVFADVNPDTFNLDPDAVEAAITPRTKAIEAVHIAGNPAGVQQLRTLANRHNLYLIEDCAQAWGARTRGKPVGTVGDVACFSFNDFKHLSCGDGGVVASNDPALGPKLQKYADKAYDRISGSHSVTTLAPNYRMSEIEAAVSAAQLERLEPITRAFHEAGSLLSAVLSEIPGVFVQKVEEGDYSSYWFYMFRLDPGFFTVDIETIVDRLVQAGIPASRGYIPLPVYRYPVFQNHAFFNGHWPVRELGLTTMDYRKVHCPQAENLLRNAIRFPLHPGLSEPIASEVGARMKALLEDYLR